MTEKTEEPIEYEEITIQVPKAVMNLLRYSQPVTEQTPKEFIEYSTVEAVRSQIEAGEFLPTELQLTNQFNLNPVFQQIINDPIQ